MPDRKDVLYELPRMSQCSTPGLLQTAQELADVTLLNEDVLQLPEGWNTDTALPEGSPTSPTPGGTPWTWSCASYRDYSTMTWARVQSLPTW